MITPFFDPIRTTDITDPRSFPRPFPPVPRVIPSARTLPFVAFAQDPEKDALHADQQRFEQQHQSGQRPARQNQNPRLRRRRDRHGRGLRGMLYPSSLPAASSRAEKFDSLVVEALEPIEARWRDQLTKLDVAVDDVPEIPQDSEIPVEGLLADGAVPLSRLVPAGVDRTGMPTRARIVLYRRPLEARAKEPAELGELVRDVLIEQIAGYLGVERNIIEGNS